MGDSATSGGELRFVGSKAGLNDLPVLTRALLEEVAFAKSGCVSIGHDCAPGTWQRVQSKA